MLEQSLWWCFVSLHLTTTILLELMAITCCRDGRLETLGIFLFINKIFVDILVMQDYFSSFNSHFCFWLTWFYYAWKQVFCSWWAYVIINTQLLESPSRLLIIVCILSLTRLNQCICKNKLLGKKHIVIQLWYNQICKDDKKMQLKRKYSEMVNYN